MIISPWVSFADVSANLALPFPLIFAQAAVNCNEQGEVCILYVRGASELGSSSNL